MKKFLVGMLVALLVLTQFMLPVLPSALAAAPTDIAGNWAEADITKLVNLGYIAGYPDGTFKPDNTVTRAEFLKIITGVMNYPEPAPAGASPYSDVAMTDWFFRFVMSAAQNNLVGGYPDGTFLPNNPITRQEVAKILVKAKVIDETTYVTADEMANMAITVPDWATVSDWAKPFVASAIKAGLMKGDPTGNFRPLANLTRAETAVVGSRLLPTEGGIKVGLALEVPQGNPPTLDGMLSPGEWEGALRQEFTDKGEMFLMRSDGYLYLGIHENFDGLTVTSVFLQHEDEISVLHSSGSLGTAIFKRKEDGWQLTQPFQWALYNVITNTPSNEQQRKEFLQNNGWLANLGSMTNTEEIEVQIAIPDGPFRIAATYLLQPNFYQAAWWPSGLSDDCLNISLLQGDIAESLYEPLLLQFAPETWTAITIP